VRVLYDDQTLYVGVVCHDSRPREVSRPLGRRDNTPYSDQVMVFVDSMRDRRTAYVFGLNAAGVQSDELLFGDDQENADWDAVWDGATATLSDGWSAEFHIPLSVLRFSGARDQVWGFAVKRILARSREEVMSIPLKRGERGMVARLADLTGLTGLEPVQELSLTPYLAARASWRPRTDQEARPRIFDPSGDLGLDLRASLGRGLALQATVNPDFGQVEADQIMQNLSTFELFFPEKRPFFTQGLDLFQGPAPHNQPSPQQLFYSRRIGLDAPILGAAKVVGRIADGLQLGLLDAVTSGTGMSGAAAAADPQAAEDAPGRRRLRWSWAQPFRLAPDGAYPLVPPPTLNHLAAVLRLEAAERLVLGLAGTSTLALSERCRLDAEALDRLEDNRRPGACDIRGGHALALDWNATGPDCTRP